MTNLQSGLVGFAFGFMPFVLVVLLGARRAFAPRRPLAKSGQAYLRALSERGQDVTPDEEAVIAAVCAVEISVMLDRKHAVCFVASDEQEAELLTDLFLTASGKRASSEGVAAHGPDVETQGEPPSAEDEDIDAANRVR